MKHCSLSSVRCPLPPRSLSTLLCSLFTVVLLILPAMASDLTLEQLLEKVQSQQGKVQDMYAETTTVITSNLQLPNSKENSGPQKMVQKSRMWTKGKNKSKMEMLSPTKQTTITNGDLMTIINPETGQTMTQDLSKMSGQGSVNSGQGGMDLAKAKEFFELTVKKQGNDYVVVGIPRQENKFMTKLEFVIDTDRWVPVVVRMFGAKNKLMNESKIEYKEFPVKYSEAPSIARSEGVWLPIKNISRIDTPMGKMDVEMVYENVKVNSGISDKVFEAGK